MKIIKKIYVAFLCVMLVTPLVSLGHDESVLDALQKPSLESRDNPLGVDVDSGGNRSEGADYNSSRSNKSHGVALPEDDNKDNDDAAPRSTGKATPKLFEALNVGDNNDGNESGKRAFVIPHVLERASARDVVNNENLRGIYIKIDDIKGESSVVVGDVDGDGRPDIDSQGKASQDVYIYRVQVTGDDVRSWSEETKAAVRERLAQNAEKVEANDFGLYVAMKALENEKIRDIVVEENEEGRVFVEVSYTARVRFLGLFSMDVPAKLQSGFIYATSPSSPMVIYETPWYIRWLSLKGDQSVFIDIIIDIQKTIEDLE